MSRTKPLFEGYITLPERFYVKPCEAAPDRFDLYALKPSKSKRRPGVKMDDVAFGLPLDIAAEKVCHMEAGKVASDMKEFLKELRKVDEEIKKNVTDYLS